MDLLQGTLDVMILKALEGRALHGYAVSRWIKRAADDVLTVEEGALYPALHRLQRKGLVTSEWGVSEKNRRAKFYELTATGRKALEAQAQNWSEYARAVDRVLSMEAPGGGRRVKLPDGFRRTTPPPGDGDRSEAEEEVRFHIESRIEDLIAEGVPAGDASRQARAEFGDPTGVAKQAARESRGGAPLAAVLSRWTVEAARDARIATRQILRNPRLWVAAVVTLALGVGGTTAVYSVVHGVLVRPLPYPDEGRVVRIWPLAPGDAEGGRQAWSVPDLLDWRARSEALSAIGAYTSTLSGLVVPDEAGAAEELQTAWVTSGFFEALGTTPALGDPLPPEAEESDPRVVVLSHGIWQRRFGADPTVVGRTMEAQQGLFRIVGVMPPEFGFPGPETEVWTFLANVRQSSVPWEVRQVRVFDAVARVRAASDDAAVDREAARRSLAAVARSIATDLPDSNGGITSVELTPIRTAIVGNVRTPLLVVLVAVSLTLLIACSNVTNLLLARGSGRQREFAVRSSLGAGRLRLVRQVMVEGLLLAFIGGLAGTVLAMTAVPALLSRSAGLLPRGETIAIDGAVLWVTFGLAAGTGLLVGILPALRAGRSGLSDGRTGSRRGKGLLNGLVFAEVGLAVVLLVGGGLLIRSFVELTSVNPGFDADGLLVAEVVFRGYDDADGYLGLRDRFLDELEAIPGVVGATTAKHFPTRGMGEVWPWRLPGEPEPLPGEGRRAQAIHIHRDYFEVMGIPLIRGTLPGADRELSLIVNERLARAAFGSADAAVGSSLVVQSEPIPVRAVVGDVLQADPASEPPPVIYVDDRINSRNVFAFVVRSDGDPLALAPSFTRALHDLDPRQPVRSFYTGRSAYADAVGQPRFFALLMAIFAAEAAALAAVGIYGVVAYSVRRRTHEIGLRIALGADQSDVRLMVMSGALKPVFGGLIAGLLTSAALSSLVTTMLFQVSGPDAATYATVAASLILVALLAASVPAREATSVDPRQALRAE